MLLSCHCSCIELPENAWCRDTDVERTYVSPFNGLFSRTISVSRHKEGYFMKQETIGWQWHQLDRMEIICIWLQTDNHANTSSLNFFTGRMLLITWSIVTDQVAWSVGLSWSWALNWSRCHLGWGLRYGFKEACIRGVHIGATWPIRLNRPCVATMWPVCQTTLTTGCNVIADSPGKTAINGSSSAVYLMILNSKMVDVLAH